MAIAQALTSATAHVPDVAAIRADMEATQAAYQQLLGAIDAADLERPCAISKWTVKQVLTHLVVNLEQAAPMMVAQARKSQPMPKLLGTRFGHWMNYTLAVHSARKATRASLAQRYDAAHTNLLNLLAGVSDNEWGRPTAYPDGRPLTLETVFQVPSEHFALHAAWIRQTLNLGIATATNKQGGTIMANKPARVVTPAEGKTMNVMGHTATIKLGRDETNGDYYTFEVVSPPGLGIPPHVHKHEDEVIYVVEGEYAIVLGGDIFTATAGATLHFPRGTPHGFQNVGAAPGKTLWHVTPGANFEPFFDELGALPPGPPDLAYVAALFGRYGMDILPPPETEQR
jgi:mannose-6-phosphate isomerase-like protein (cupin superfamily)